MSLTVNAPNAAPVANDDSYETPSDVALTVPAPGVLGNDSDADGDALTATLVSNVSNGVLIFNSDGAFTYTPNPGYSGPDSFTYVANDGTADSAVAATVSLAVTGNAAPVAADDSYETPSDVARNNFV